MSQDEFTRLYTYMTQQFDAFHADLADTREEFSERLDGLHNHLDSLHAKADIDDTERLVMAKQLTQHEDWIEKAGEKLGLRYDHAG